MTTTTRPESPFVSTLPGRYYYDPAVVNKVKSGQVLGRRVSNRADCQMICRIVP